MAPGRSLVACREPCPSTHHSSGALIDVKVHAALAVVIYDTLPRPAQDFLRLSDVELHHWARVPDEQDHDALAQTGCDVGVECHAHSYKMKKNDDGSFTHLTGSVHTWLGRTPMEVRSYIQEGQFDVAREMFVKAFSHAAIDVSTPWHLTRTLTSEQHSNGERELAAKLTMLLPSTPRAKLLSDPKSLSHSAVLHAQATYDKFVDALAAVQAKGKVTDDVVLAKAIIDNALAFGIATAYYIWNHIAKL